MGLLDEVNNRKFSPQGGGGGLLTKVFIGVAVGATGFLAYKNLDLITSWLPFFGPKDLDETDYRLKRDNLTIFLKKESSNDDILNSIDIVDADGNIVETDSISVQSTPNTDEVGIYEVLLHIEIGGEKYKEYITINVVDSNTENILSGYSNYTDSCETVCVKSKEHLITSFELSNHNVVSVGYSTYPEGDRILVVLNNEKGEQIKKYRLSTTSGIIDLNSIKAVNIDEYVYIGSNTDFLKLDFSDLDDPISFLRTMPKVIKDLEVFDNKIILSYSDQIIKISNDSDPGTNFLSPILLDSNLKEVVVSNTGVVYTLNDIGDVKKFVDNDASTLIDDIDSGDNITTSNIILSNDKLLVMGKNGSNAVASVYDNESTLLFSTEYVQSLAWPSNFNTAISIDDNEYVFAGNVSPGAHRQEDMLIVSFDNEGKIIYEKTPDDLFSLHEYDDQSSADYLSNTSDDEIIRGLTLLSDNNILITGYIETKEEDNFFGFNFKAPINF